MPTDARMRPSRARLVGAGLVFLVGIAAAAGSASADLPGNPAWSPSGSEIAFPDMSEGQLAVMRASDGGGKRTLYSSNDACCVPIVWAAGGRIVFVDGYRLFRVAASGGTKKRLFGDADWFILSPNRKTIAFDDGCGCPESPDAVGLVSVSGGKPIIVPKPKTASDSIDGFSPGGKQLVFTRYPNPDGGTPTLMAEHVGGGKPVPFRRSGLTGASALPAGAANVQWSPDGRWIAFEHAQKIEVVNTSGGTPRVLVPSLNSGDGFSWSPTSKQLAYVAYVSPGRARLATVDLQGHRKLLWNSALNYQTQNSLAGPQWSPDGSKLVFAATTGLPSPTTYIWVINANGTGLKKLA